MKSFTKRSYSFRADANALGGFLQEPFQTNIPTLAPVSLPAVGGFALARSEAFTLAEIIKCSSAYSHVSGRENADGSTSILITAVVEGLNLLEVVTARRVVAQIAISDPNNGAPRRISLEGSVFEDLKLGGRECPPKLNPGLQQPLDSAGGNGALTWPAIEKIGRAQADTLIKGFQGWGAAALNWIQKRHEWRARNPQPGSILCSLVNEIEGGGSTTCCGHVVDIPNFGRITLGELRVSGDSVQLVMIRADLGCPVTGGVTISCAGGGGTGEN
jgi:hypothetical protein